MAIRDKTGKKRTQKRSRGSSLLLEYIRKEKRLSAQSLSKSFRKRKVVDGVTLHVKSGEIVGLLGPNGAGKTTSFHMIIGLVKPDGGKVFLGKEDITALPVHMRARKGIGYLPQETSIFRRLSVEENIMAILETTGLSGEEQRERLDLLLNDLGIAHIAKSKAYNLSGGECRRVEIARALVTSPVFILLDEPFAGIDPIAVRDLQEIIFELKKKGIGVLITDHNVRETLKICDRGYILYDGKVLETGRPESLALSRQAQERYLGEGFTM